MRKLGFFVLGALTGGLLGGLLSILLTPASGEDLRGQITGYAQRIQDEMKQAGQQKREEMELELARLRSSQS